MMADTLIPPTPLADKLRILADLLDYGRKRSWVVNELRHITVQVEALEKEKSTDDV